MEFAIEKEKITPRHPVFMAGFGARTSKSEGVLDELYARVLLLRSERRLLIITLDVLGGDRGFTIGIRSALKERFGLAADEILVHFTHTHASVYVTGELPEWRRGNYSMAQENWPDDADAIRYEEDVLYYHQLKAQVIEMTERCVSRLRPGKLSVSFGVSRAAVQRRKWTEGGIRWIPNYAATIDQTLTVLRVVNEEGVMQAVLFSTGCHPTTMNHTIGQLSAEFVGEASLCIEKACPAATAMFLQGCAGDLKPLQTARGDRFIACTVEEMKQAGSNLADECIQLLQHGKFRELSGPIRVGMAETMLDTEATDLAWLEQEAASGQRGPFYRNAAQRLLRLLQQHNARENLPVAVTTWWLDQKTCLVALENEIPTDYALMIKKYYPNLDLIMVGYSNAVYTYIPTLKILREGGYEADHPRTTGIRGRFAPDTEERMLSAIRASIEKNGSAQ